MSQDDRIQHGIDDNPNYDAEKGAAVGGLGGLAVGAAAGSMVGPVGAIVGAVIGGLAGAGASGAAVAAVDRVDNDNTVTGIGETPEIERTSEDYGSRDYTWDDVSPHYRQGWEKSYGSSGQRWEDVEPAHRYAWETSDDELFRDRSYDSAQSEIEQSWRTRNPDRDWNAYEPQIREGWESAYEIRRGMRSGS